MFMDALLMVSDAQALTATALSTNTVDLGAPTVKRRIGTGEPIVLAVQIDTGADFTTGDETYEVQIIQSAAANLSSADILARFPLLAASGALGTGKKFSLPIPAGFPNKQYLGANYVLAGTTPSVTLTASFMPRSMAEAEYTYYPKGYSA
jgi:hypothetical protein